MKTYRMFVEDILSDFIRKTAEKKFPSKVYVDPNFEKAAKEINQMNPGFKPGNRESTNVIDLRGPGKDYDEYKKYWDYFDKINKFGLPDPLFNKIENLKISEKAKFWKHIEHAPVIKTREELIGEVINALKLMGKF